MRLSTSFVAFVALFATSSSIASPVPSTRGGCDPKARGPLLRQRQEAAIKDFAKIFLVEKDPQKAFDKYMPGEYTQHNPDALDGRQAAIDFLIELWGTPGITFSDISAWAGEGQGMLHYRMRAEGVMHYAVMDRLNFEGTCFNEHWDVLQAITGKETNPRAFF